MIDSLVYIVDITIGLSKEDPLYDQKKKYLEKSGKDVLAARFPLQRDRYPSELVDFLRLLLVEAEDLAMQVCHFPLPFLHSPLCLLVVDCCYYCLVD